MRIIEESSSEIWIEVGIKKPVKTIISTEDKKFMEIFPNWGYWGSYITCHRYVKTEYGQAKESYYLHRLILLDILKVSPQGIEVDHKNRDRLDNRRCNLRMADRRKNNVNRSKNSGCTSKYKGVYKNKNVKINKWTAYHKKNGKKLFLGNFKTEIEAAAAYNIASRELWGEFAYQNKIELDY